MLRAHQKDGAAFAKRMYGKRLRAVSAAMYEIDKVKGGYKYLQESAQKSLTIAVGNCGVLLAWPMGLGKSAGGVFIATHLKEWAEEWDTEGWLHPEVKRRLSLPTLVVCPNSIKGVWRAELQKWAGFGELDVVVLDANKDDFRFGLAYLAAGMASVAITSYSTIRARIKDGIGNLEWGMVVADELQSISNSAAAQTQSLYNIKCTLRLGLSGTPYTNKPDRLHGSLAFIQGYTVAETDYSGKVKAYLRRSPIWGSQREFEDTYCEIEQGRFRHIVGANANVRHETAWFHECKYDSKPFHLEERCKALHPRMARELMHRVRLEDCVDLPKLSIVNAPCELTEVQEHLYGKLMEGVLAWVNSSDTDNMTTANILAQMTYAFELCSDIRQLGVSIARKRVSQSLSIVDYSGIKSEMFRALKPKDASGKLNWLLDAIDDDIEGKVLIFSEFRETCNLIADALRREGCALLTGEDRGVLYPNFFRPMKDAKAIENAFQNDDGVRFFVGTRAAFEGLTLTAADTVVLFGKVDWTPGKVMQAIGRAYGRLNQLKPITVFRLYSEDTVEEWLQSVLAKKQKDFDATMDDDKIDRHSLLELGDKTSILNAFRGK
jgi:SNF2 family DNA or RNA helicase